MGALVTVQDTENRGKILVSQAALKLGDLILSERPAVRVTQASKVPVLEDLQSWVDSFAALDDALRSQVLELCCPDEAAAGGALANLLGSTGERLSTLLNCPSSISEQDLWRCLLISECNTFAVPAAGGGFNIELLVTTSRLNHSCFPNALRGPGEIEGTCEVRAILPVEPGEELTICYVDEDTLTSPAEMRKDRLHGRWQFVCACPRCPAPDSLRAFRCTVPACEGGLHFADGRILGPCVRCGMVPSQDGQPRLSGRKPNCLRPCHKRNRRSTVHAP